ncbi:MAG TPA: PadR family transcriptional regulator [Candidatus Baltobacteraceae bacterium]|jgi:DNA-binding PadR family transcriptional regulator|nr:PadR family transcriptional regulator [Candidatus Baltobacteraceae bacterium]
MGRRLSAQALRVLEAFLGAPQHTAYGYGISRATGVKSGSLYPILMRLAEQQLVEASWEQPQDGKPPRHVYRLTPKGLQLALDARRAAPSPKARATLRAARS